MGIHDVLKITTVILVVVCRCSAAAFDGVFDRRTALEAGVAATSPACTDGSTNHRSRRDTRRSSTETLRNPRHAFSLPVGDRLDFGKAVYFRGHQTLLLRLPEGPNKVRAIPRHSFTFEAWVNAEGGQVDGATIIGVYDVCTTASNRKRTWSVGIHPSEGNRGARLYFSLRTDRSPIEETIWALRAYIPARWFHLAVIYDGRQMKLHIDGAKVAVGHTQRGDLFSASLQRCKQLLLGGDYNGQSFFRGTVDEVRLWDYPLKHKDIVSSLQHAFAKRHGLVVLENFDGLHNWVNHTESGPASVPSDIPEKANYPSLVVPPCGRTVCDDPDVIRSYSANSGLRRPKMINYRLVNVYNDDGTNPTVTSLQMDIQQKALNQAFMPYNISWTMAEHKIFNSSLRSRTILDECNPYEVGNGRCNLKCNHPKTGNDGGDCDLMTVPCDGDRIGNGRCDFECNKQYHSWDGGDCCDPNSVDTSKTCFDPTSIHRAYLSIAEYKSFLNLSASSNLNVYFANWITTGILGVATFPWDKNVYGIHGGATVNPDKFGKLGKTDNLIHELGHTLGLWHVFRGVTEMECSDECLEIEPSLELGDLVADTPPTPKNMKCSDPDTLSGGQCGFKVFTNTLFRNYMGYADDACMDSFTHQQMARMHCYLDLVYQPWQRVKAPSPPPLAPKIITTTSSTATLSWVPPLGTKIVGDNEVCNSCQMDGSLVQFASRAVSPNYFRGHHDYSPVQATGGPDAEECGLSANTWAPASMECLDDCYIDLFFEYKVIPHRTLGAKNGVKDVVLYLADGSKHHLGPIEAYCDVEYTTRLDVNQSVQKVRVVLANSLVAIDAIQLVSRLDNSECRQCKPVKYQITRNPQFTHSNPLTNIPVYLDRNVEVGKSYEYQVIAIMGKKSSGPSPILTYKHGQPYCGNGKMEKENGEECDDGNTVDGDGCTMKCKIERFFNCKGQPSLCYLHNGDGECEEFEKRSSIHDCGFYTPDGFVDQWAISAVANPEFQRHDCPESVVIGPPPKTMTCQAKIDTQLSWYPCGHYTEDDNFWIKVQFSTPVIAVAVVVHLASDGITKYSMETKALSVELTDEHGNNYPIGNKDVKLKCKDNPVTVDVMHDLSKPFFRTKGVIIRFRSYHIAIAAVTLRSSKHLDPITIGNCATNELYNPHTGHCVAYTCKRPLCNKLNVANGETACTGNEDGDTCKVACNTGYSLDSYEDEVMCTRQQWVNSGSGSVSNLLCKPVDCGHPDILYATVVCPEGTEHGSQCSFKCNLPARMFGSNNIIRCDADGLWSLPDAFCQVTCTPPSVDDDAHLVTRTCLDRESHTVGTKCRYKCKRGYHVEDMPMRRRVSHLVCDDNGQWFGPTCVPVKCPPPNSVFSGLYNCTNDLLPGSTCALRCPGAARASSWIICRQNGRWNSTFTMCDFGEMKCPQPPANHILRFRCTDTKIGSLCVVSCRMQYYDVVMNYGRITGPEKLTKNQILCTGMQEWFPPVTSLGCVEKCMAMYIGDSWCDAKNNRAYCQWDGGDCCASTVEGGAVQPFTRAGNDQDAECARGCTCEDPAAEENKQLPVRQVRERNRVKTRRLGDL
ncbi:pappalysin-1-like [Tubulanus polymorphus]|uniref:pappalysin-1-like n=1 Tax=Tubulanus polymorphus TaxID=672921 RepID=UPI003DA2DF6E